MGLPHHSPPLGPAAGRLTSREWLALALGAPSLMVLVCLVVPSIFGSTDWVLMHGPGEAAPAGTSGQTTIAKSTGSQEATRAKLPAGSVTDLSARAISALPHGGLGLRLSPALPVTWPAPSPELEWFVYQFAPLPTGVVAYKVTGPAHRISMKVPDGQPQVAAVAGGKELGQDRAGRAAAIKLETAQQALLDVIMGRRAPDSARTELAAYMRWAAASSTIGADVRQRKPEFFRWLDAAKP